MPKEKRPCFRNKDKPHDALFKAFFSDVKIAQNYLLHYVSPAVHEKIDFSFFRKIDATFVSGHFGISFSDVVYETRLATGAPDDSVPFRCARMEKIGEALLLLTLRYPGTTNLFISQ